jgi:hypothetical protein
MRRFRGRPLSVREVYFRTLEFLALAFACALMGWLFYTQPVGDSGATELSSAGTSAAVPDQGPKP